MNTQSNLNWSRTLTIGNAEHVAKSLSDLLDGKRFTLLESRESKNFIPDIFRGLRLIVDGSGKAINIHNINNFNKTISINTTRGLCVISTSLTGNKHKDIFRNPFLKFVYNDSVIIFNRSPEGELIHRVYLIEQTRGHSQC